MDLVPQVEACGNATDTEAFRSGSTCISLVLASTTRVLYIPSCISFCNVSCLPHHGASTSQHICTLRRAAGSALTGPDHFFDVSTAGTVTYRLATPVSGLTNIILLDL